MLRIEQAAALIEAGHCRVYGLRADVGLRVGAALPEGTTAVRVQDAEHLPAAIRAMAPYLEAMPRARIYLLGADAAMDGENAGEVVLTEARVLGTLT